MKIEQSHLGICVSDLERSVRFYRDGLGFEEGPSFEIDYPISEMSGDVRLTSKFLHSGDLRIELLAFQSPAAIGTPSAQRNKRGLTHLSFSVEDLDDVAAQAVRMAARSFRARAPRRKAASTSFSWPTPTARASS